MTALIDSGHVPQKNVPFNNFRTTDLRFTSQAFGREPNALPKLCNFLRSKKFGSPGRIRTSNISVDSRETNFIRTCRKALIRTVPILDYFRIARPSARNQCEPTNSRSSSASTRLVSSRASVDLGITKGILRSKVGRSRMRGSRFNAGPSERGRIRPVTR